MPDKRGDIRFKITNETQKKKIADLERSLKGKRQYSKWGKSQLRALAMEEGLKQLLRDDNAIDGFTEEERLLNKIIYLNEARRQENVVLLNIILQDPKVAENVLKQAPEELKYKYTAVNETVKGKINGKNK